MEWTHIGENLFFASAKGYDERYNLSFYLKMEFCKDILPLDRWGMRQGRVCPRLVLTWHPTPRFRRPPPWFVLVLFLQNALCLDLSRFCFCKMSSNFCPNSIFAKCPNIFFMQKNTPPHLCPNFLQNVFHLNLSNFYLQNAQVRKKCLAVLTLNWKQRGESV